jgi:hypothetical protein
MRLALFILFLVAVVAVSLAMQPENVDSRNHAVALALPFTYQKLTGSALAMLGGFFGTGLVLGYLMALPGRVGASSRARKAEKQLAQAQTAGTTARVEAAEAKADARAATTEADEMQRLADEVARRTQTTVGRDVPPRV